jgi:hypothetical protein
VITLRCRLSANSGSLAGRAGLKRPVESQKPRRRNAGWRGWLINSSSPAYSCPEGRGRVRWLLLNARHRKAAC